MGLKLKKLLLIEYVFGIRKYVATSSWPLFLSLKIGHQMISQIFKNLFNQFTSQVRVEKINKN